MSKKIKCILVCALCCCLMTGCNDVIDLTEEQSTLIAEYAAELLLKYDLSYEDRIHEGEKEAQKLEEEEVFREDEPTTTETVASEAELEEDTVEEETGGALDEQDTEKPVVGNEQDIAKIAGITGVSITYKDYLVTDQYPATDDEGEFIHLEASSGYQLLVLCFNVMNTTDNMADVSLLDANIDYRIVCNGSKAANAMLTILMNDLGTLETSVKPDEVQEAVLVFQISEDMKDTLDTIELKVNYNDTDNVIKIK